jgi:hypothetical protein
VKAAARILVTAAALAALSTLGLGATATASPPKPDERPQQTTTDDPNVLNALFRSGEHASQQPATQVHLTVPNSGRGAQFDRDDPAFVSAPPGRRHVPVLGATLLVLLLALAGATWLRLRHRPREAI